ncbi:MAG: hypothetical protein ACREBJ_08230 [Nitrosotalea sp.]
MSYDQDDTIFIKVCKRRVTHEISYFADVPTYEVYKATIRLNGEPIRYVTWIFTKKELFVMARSGKPNIMHLPYFEPDLTDYNKLVDKIKTYVVFS